MLNVLVTGIFDNLRSGHVRFLEESAKLGSVHVALWNDRSAARLNGTSPRFPEQERLYLLQSLRYVDRVTLVEGGEAVLQQLNGAKPGLWAIDPTTDTAEFRASAKVHAIRYRIIANAETTGFTAPPFDPSAIDPSRKRVIVTGCYDWFHSGHVRFFEEASTLGDLFVVVGHDANIRLLKGNGHPLLSQAERLYMVHAVRCVTHAMVSTGHGWLDAEPEIALLKPDFYVVNEDGDKPEKRAFCEAIGIDYVVLKRTPKEGLPRRESTQLRGF